MGPTLYRRPLPPDAIAFSSPEGRDVFAEALASGGLNGYFPLAEQFHTQSDPAFCGLGSLVVALNAMAIDPERLWKGPWRWFAEDLLDCCVPLADVRERGLDLDELACLARCNGADVDVHRGDTESLAGWRAALQIAARGEAVIVAAYDRGGLGQTGAGHFSPIGGYHATRDLALILDVARFKYPSHWVSAERLWHAMQPIDSATGRARGWLILRRRAQATALGFTLTCAAESWGALSRRVTTVKAELASALNIEQLARTVLPLASHLQMREAGTATRQEALSFARVALHTSAVYPAVEQAVGLEHAEAVTLLLWALADDLPPTQRARLDTVDGTIIAEVSNMRAQLAALTMEGVAAALPENPSWNTVSA